MLGYRCYDRAAKTNLSSNHLQCILKETVDALLPYNVTAMNNAQLQELWATSSLTETRSHDIIAE